MSDILDELRAIVGDSNCIRGSEAGRYAQDWKKAYSWQPLAVVRPASTDEVSAVVKCANAHEVAIVPVSGNTGLNGGTSAEGAIMISLERMNAIRQIKPEARVAIVDAGVVLSQLHDAVAEHGLAFPLTFGARGSAMIGGCLATNAGGSNVLRYGNTRALALGLEVVLPDGEVLDLMTELHKDNTGYDLRDLFIGAEGTLGLITAAVVKLVRQPRAYATAMVSAASIPAALTLLNRLQDSTGGMVEAFEYMPRCYLEALRKAKPELVPPLGYERDHTIMVELGATADRDSSADEQGEIPVTALLETALSDLIDAGLADDAVIAQNETQRAQMWHIRETSAEVVFAFPHFVDTDVSVPLDRVDAFLQEAEAGRLSLDPESSVHIVSHLGDGNVHYTPLPTRGDAEFGESIREMVEDIALRHGGSFSAEHGIGLSKRGGMKRRKDPVALRVMHQIKAALDPKSLMNPGKVLPDA